MLDLSSLASQEHYNEMMLNKTTLFKDLLYTDEISGSLGSVDPVTYSGLILGKALQP